MFAQATALRLEALYSSSAVSYHQVRDCYSGIHALAMPILGARAVVIDEAVRSGDDEVYSISKCRP